MKLKQVIIFSILLLMSLSLMPSSYAFVDSTNPPILAFDEIHSSGDLPDHIKDSAKSLEFIVRYIDDNTIIPSDLENVNVYFVRRLGSPMYSQSEIDLILEFVKKGGGIYIEACYADTAYNEFFYHFGFKISGTQYHLEFPHIRNVTFTHPILDGVNEIEHPYNYVEELFYLASPARAILTVEGHPLFLVSSLGGGRVFVDFCEAGIGNRDLYDNPLIPKNALRWLKGVSRETFNIVVDGTPFTVTVETNSTISSFEFEKNLGRISFRASGLLGTEGFCNVTIPHDLLSPPYNITLNGSEVTYENESINIVHFSYAHVSVLEEPLEIAVIPEFPSFLILPLFIIATLLAVIVYRRKHIMQH